jgi:hypothetical protein
LWKFLGQWRQCWMLMTRLINMILRMTLRRKILQMMKTTRRRMMMMTRWSGYQVRMKNTLIKNMIPWCWLVLTKTKMMKNYPKAKPHGCINTSIEKISLNLMVASKYVNYNTSVVQT